MLIDCSGETAITGSTRRRDPLQNALAVLPPRLGRFTVLILLLFLFGLTTNINGGAYAQLNVCTITNATSFAFGSNSSLYTKYNYANVKSLTLPVVMDVVGDPYPEIFFVRSTSTVNPCAYPTGPLTALHYDPITNDLTPLWQTSFSVPAYIQHAVARVPNSNRAIVCGFYDNVQVFCSDASTGALIFRQPVSDFCILMNVYGGVAIQRLFSASNDLFIIVSGKIYRYFAATSTSALYCNLNPLISYLLLPYAADINNDGIEEIFYGNCVISALNCLNIWCINIPSGFQLASAITSAVANLDSDPQAEVVFSSSNWVAVYEHTGAFKWQTNTPFIPSYLNAGGAPAIADFNGDGIPDIGVTTLNYYYVLNGLNGGILKKLTTLYDNSWFTSTSAFDFQNDGKSEFLVCDILRCHVISMNWTLTIDHMSATSSEYPVVADIDLDGMADIVVVGQNLSVISSLDSWAGADTSWNFHGFNGANRNPITGNTLVTTVTKSFRSKPTTR